MRRSMRALGWTAKVALMLHLEIECISQYSDMRCSEVGGHGMKKAGRCKISGGDSAFN